MSTIHARPSSGPDYDAADVLVVSRPEQLRALGDDLRSRVVALLRERAYSIQELAEDLGLPKGTVGHHVKVLQRAGLIHVVRTRQIRGVTAKYYGRVARLFLFEAEDPDDARAIAGATFRRAAEEIERAPARATFGLVRARLSADDAARFERRLERLLHDFRAAETADGRLHGLAAGLWAVEEGDV